MEEFIVRANIDHYLDLLSKDGIPPSTRATIGKLLIEEENKLSRDLEQLEFAESRAASCQDRVNRLERLRESLALGSADRVQADRLLENFEATLNIAQGFCARMRARLRVEAL